MPEQSGSRWAVGLMVFLFIAALSLAGYYHNEIQVLRRRSDSWEALTKTCAKAGMEAVAEAHKSNELARQALDQRDDAIAGREAADSNLKECLATTNSAIDLLYSLPMEAIEGLRRSERRKSLLVSPGNTFSYPGPL